MPDTLKIIGLSDNDKEKHNTTHLDFRVIPPAELKNIDFDYIIVTSKFVQEIKSGLVNLGVDSVKILGFNNSFNSKILVETNSDLDLLNQLGFSIPKISLTSMYLWPKAGENNALFQDDFVRYMSINLLAERLNRHKVGGNIAELGVYKGDLSVFLNSIFPEKKKPNYFLLPDFAGSIVLMK